MKRDKFQEVKDAASAYDAAIYLAVSDDSNIHNPRRKSVWAAMENIYPLTKLQTCDWCEELRKETMDNLLTIHPDDRPLVMKETIHGLFDSFEKSYWLSDLTKIEGMETLDVSLYSYGVKIMDCLIPDHYSVDDWRISEMNEDIREYLECIGILAEDMMGVLQDIVGKGSFEAKDSITGLSLFEENSQTTPTEELKTSLTDEKQEKQNQQPKKKGRRVKPFKDKMIDDADGKKLQKIHSVMSGKTGKDAILIVYASFDKGWVMPKPSYTAVTEEFGAVVSKSEYDEYWKNAENKFTEQEIDGIKKILAIEEGENRS